MSLGDLFSLRAKKEAGSGKKKKEVESGAVDNRTGARCITPSKNNAVKQGTRNLMGL